MLQVFRHKEGEIWSLSASTKQPNIIASCYNTINESDGQFGMKTSLWNFPDQSENDMECLCDLDVHEHGTDIKVYLSYTSSIVECSGFQLVNLIVISCR